MAQGQDPDAGAANRGNSERKTMRTSGALESDSRGRFQSFLAAVESSSPSVDDDEFVAGRSWALQVAWGASNVGTNPAQVLSALDAEPPLLAAGQRMGYGVTVQILMAFLMGLDAGRRAPSGGGASKPL